MIEPLEPNAGVLAFLSTRRSRSAKTLTAPGPTREQIQEILTLAARCPDHGKLEPWRFIVIAGEAQNRLSALAAKRAEEIGLEDAAVEKTAAAFLFGPLIIAVISSPVDSEKIPLWEQESSAAAVCLSLINAAQAAGWGANWLTGKLARDATFLRTGLSARDGETIAGFIHIGQEGVVPADRPRPDIEALTTWL